MAYACLRGTRLIEGFAYLCLDIGLLDKALCSGLQF